jgi:non-ribosomal peptide synthetase component F
MPYDRSSVHTYKLASTLINVLDASAAAKLYELVRRSGGTSYRILLGACMVTLFALTGVVDAPVTAAVANRTNWHFRQTVGWIANEIVFRERLDPKERVSEFIARLGDCIDEGLDHQEVPYHLVLDSIAHDFPGQPTALDQVSFRLNAPPRNKEFGYSFFVNQAPGYKVSWAGYQIQTVAIEVDDCVRDLEFVARVSTDAVTLILVCRGDVFSPAAGQRILDLFESILIAMLNDPEQVIAKIVRK